MSAKGGEGKCSNAAGLDKFLASTSDIEQMTGGGSLARDLVSLPQPTIGVHMLRANSALGA